MPGILRAYAEVQKKMRCALQHIHPNTPKFLERRHVPSVQKSVEKKVVNFQLDSGTSSIGQGNVGNCCGYITFLMLESENHWRIVAVPVQCTNHSNNSRSRGQFKTSLRGVQSRALQGNPNYSCPGKSCTSSGETRQWCSQNRTLEDKAVKYSATGRSSSCKNSLTLSDISDFIPAIPNGMHSSTTSKVLKRKSRKKGKKKGKQNKQISSKYGSVEREITVECTNGLSTSETYADNDTDQDEPALHETALVISSSDSRTDKSEYARGSDGVIDYSDKLSASSSLIDGEEVSEVDTRFTHKRLLLKSDKSIRTTEPEGMEGTYYCDQVSCFSDVHSGSYHEMRDSFVLDTESVCWDSNDSPTTVLTCIDDSSDVTLSESPPSVGVDDGIGFESVSNLLGVADNHSDEKLLVTMDGSSGDSRFLVNGKNGKQPSAKPRNCRVFRPSNGKHLHGQVGKKNNHSPQHKVQRSENDEPRQGHTVKKENLENDEPRQGHTVKKENLCPDLDIPLKEAFLLERNCDFVDTDFSSKVSDTEQFKVVSRKSRKKASPGTRQNCYSTKGSHLVKDNHLHAKVGKQNGKFNDPGQLNGKGGLSSGPSPRIQSSWSKSGLHTNKMEYHSEKPHLGSQRHPPTLHMLDAQTSETRTSLTSKSNHFNNSILEEPYQVHDPAVKGKGIVEVEKEVPLSQINAQDYTSGPSLQKWVPVGIKDSGSTSCQRSESSLLVLPSKPPAEGGALLTISESRSPSISLLSVNNGGVVPKVQNSLDVLLSHQEGEAQNHKVRSPTICSSVETDLGANSSAHDSKSIETSSFRTDSQKIASAINDACRVHLDSEAVQMATGSPISEFERFDYSASPVFLQSNCHVRCQTCKRDQLSIKYLCRHETPHVPLANVWKWYDKHGSYGLEVQGDGYKGSRRMGSDRSVFRAYFVPYLSAVQLFRIPKRDTKYKGFGIPEPDILKSEMTQASRNTSSAIHCPILSVRVPKLCTEDTISLQLQRQACDSVASSLPAEEHTPFNFVDTKTSDDFELFFEYFETDQPQTRRPLFDKITELIHSGLSPGRAYGDPTSLASTDIHDLHPRSWYAVAWYPIYRIPEGSFRAAFLTYHSLGHLAQRTAKSNSSNREMCIVSPVIGLRSYNAKDECWFQSKHTETSQNSKLSSLNPSEILKDRLRTLEETATLMATATVKKGDTTSVNRHPDFEFFSSRRR